MKGIETNCTINSDGTEFHSIVCNVCEKKAYPSHQNPFVFFGFRCSDTGMFVCKSCKSQYYQNKNRGVYGMQHRHKYSEIPVPVPYKNQPSYIEEGQQLSLIF